METNRTRHSRVALALLAALFAPAVWADSLASSASDSTSSAASSTSDSIEGSSHSSGRSSGDEHHAAAGTYQVVAMAPNAARAGTMRVHLAQVDAADESFDLILPEAAARRGELAVGARVDVSERPYGYAFARTADAAPFFLALDDASARGMKLRAVDAS